MTGAPAMFRGLSAFPLTPADAGGTVAAEAFAELIAPIGRAGADSAGILGSTGAYAYLDRAERRRAVEIAVATLGGATPVLAGVGALRTDAACDLARDAAAAGADGLLLAPVSYTPLTEEEVYHHVAAVAATTELPLCLYNNPTTTKFTFSEALIARLAALPTVAAVKMPLPPDGALAAEIASLRAAVPGDFAIGYSGDWGAADALLAGADAWYSVAAGLFPGPALRLTRAARTGDTAETRRIDAGFTDLWALFRAHGSLRVMYAAVAARGFGDHSPPRPLLPLPASEQARVAEAVAAIDALD